MADPFKRILLIVMSREGFAEITGILNEGIEQYENSTCNEIVAKCENAKWRKKPTPFYKLEYKSNPIYVGTLIDVVGILSIKSCLIGTILSSPAMNIRGNIMRTSWASLPTTCSLSRGID